MRWAPISNSIYQNRGLANFSYILTSNNVEGRRITAEVLDKSIGYKGGVHVVVVLRQRSLGVVKVTGTTMLEEIIRLMVI